MKIKLKIAGKDSEIIANEITIKSLKTATLIQYSGNEKGTIILHMDAWKNKLNEVKIEQ